MKQGRWVAVLVLMLGWALYVGARESQRSLPIPQATAPSVARETTEAPTDPWVPGMPGTELTYDPFQEGGLRSAGDPLTDLLRDLGVDFRGLGSMSTGIGGPGMEDGASAGRDNSGAGLPAAGALNPRAGAYFNDGLRDDVFAGTTANPSGVPFGTNAEPSSVGSARDGRNFTYGEAQDLSRQRAVEDALAEMSATEEQRLMTAEDFPADWWKEISARRAAARPTFGDVAVEAPVRKVTRRTWKRATATPNAVRLTVGDDDELPLEAMDITVQVEGFRARVILDCFFRNNREKQLNGSFALRLPTGASPHYFAFGRTKLTTRTFRPHAVAALADIRATRTPTWDAPKEARMVAREAAARAYTETIRERIDPALMEWSGAGVFTAQVFPLEPGALHHIVVAYDTDLQRDGENLVHRLELPRGVASLDVEIAARDGAGDDARRRITDPKGKEIVTTIDGPAPIVLTGESSEAGALFATEFVPALPGMEAATNPRAVFLLDVSASSTPERFNAWLALLESVLRENRPTLHEFAVLCFNVESFWWKPGFAPNNADTLRALRTFTDDLLLEGATDLGAALRAAGTLDGAFDVFLLSDGGVTWGETNVHALATGLDASHPVFGYVVPGGGTDPRVLQHLARRSGGAVFPVRTEAEVHVAARAHRKRPWKLEGITLDGASDLLLAGRPSVLFPGQTLRLVGRGTPAPDAEVVLQVAQGSEKRTLRVPLGRTLHSALTARTYGQVAVSQLESLGESAAQEARAYAAHFRVVGSSCSLLMLESEADYKRRGITAEDLAPVKAAHASTVVAARVAAAEATLADPKPRFLAMLERLERLPRTVRVELPSSLRTLLGTLPPAAFKVEAPALAAKIRTATAVPASVREALGAGRLGYDAAVAEASRREALHGSADALKALSTLVEQHPGDLTLARDVAFSALAWERRAEAYHLLRRVADRRPWESPTWLAIARCLDGLGNTDLALVFYELALHGGSTERYGALRRVAALDYARLLCAIVAGERTSALGAYAKGRLPEVIKQRGMGRADILVVLEWNTDRTDVDLHITDPAGDHCYYEHPSTAMGGQLSTDVRTGFGPEMFVLSKATAGTYEIHAHYFGSDALRTKARSKVYARIYEDWGGPKEKVRRVSFTLKDKDSRYVIGTVKR